MTVHIRRFLPHEAGAYKAIRLEALALDRGMFGNSYETEAAFDDAHWGDRLRNPDVACFGLFDGEALIGLTSILRDAERRAEAYMTQSYIRKAYRGRGLSAMLYEARIGWAREVGIARLLIGHRERNAASAAAIRRYGFAFSHCVSRQWPDGATEDMIYYTLDL